MAERDKVGFLDGFRAHNVNVADPHTEGKWKRLRKDILNYAKEIKTQNNYNNQSELFQIINLLNNNNEIPDELYKTGKALESFVENAPRQNLKDDQSILKLIYRYAEVAKLSQDPRIIQIAFNLSEHMIKLSKTNN